MVREADAKDGRVAWLASRRRAGSSSNALAGARTHTSHAAFATSATRIVAPSNERSLCWNGWSATRSDGRPSILSRHVPITQGADYRLYFFGQIVSTTGTWMQAVAQVWLVLRLTHSGLALGITTGLQFLPVLLLGPLGGLVADRFDKRKVLIRRKRPTPCWR